MAAKKNSFDLTFVPLDGLALAWLHLGQGQYDASAMETLTPVDRAVLRVLLRDALACLGEVERVDAEVSARHPAISEEDAERFGGRGLLSGHVPEREL